MELSGIDEQEREEDVREILRELEIEFSVHRKAFRNMSAALLSSLLVALPGMLSPWISTIHPLFVPSLSIGIMAGSILTFWYYVGQFKRVEMKRSRRYALLACRAQTYLKNRNIEGAEKEVKSLSFYINNRWGLKEKMKRNDLEDMDVLFNPAVKVSLILEASKRAFAEGKKDSIAELENYMLTLMKFFLYPSDKTMLNLLDTSVIFEVKKDSFSKIAEFVVDKIKARYWIKHAAILGGAAISGVVTFYLVLSWQPAEPDFTGALQASLMVVAIIVGVYGALRQRQSL